MKNKLKGFWAIVIVSIPIASSAQNEFTLSVSPLYSRIHFIDDRNEIMSRDYKGRFVSAYHLGFRHIAESGFMLTGAAGIRNAASSLVYDGLQYSWNMQYGDLRAGMGFAYGLGTLRQYINLSGYYAYLFGGTQVLNNEQIDIIESQAFDRNDMGLVISPGIDFGISESLRGLVEVNYIHGLKNIEMDQGQKTFQRAYSVSLGIAVGLGNKSNP